jgi:hypothetical protein
MAPRPAGDNQDATDLRGNPLPPSAGRVERFHFPLLCDLDLDWQSSP